MGSQSQSTGIEDGEFLHGTFPDGFLWGMGTAATQCEGGWDADGKGKSIWDAFVRAKPERILDRSTCDVALDSYHHYKQDVQMLKAIGASVYRFSLSWPRILPTGRIDKINQAGIDYYNSLINELLANGIQPMVTIYHWDLPQALQETGGWLEDEIINLFADYARLCFEKFGDRVKRWTTLNEPFISGMMSYGLNNFCPDENKPLEGPYQYVHNQLKAHAEAYHIYEKEFRPTQKGLVGITLDTSCYLPDNKDSAEDVEAANRAFYFRLGWMLNPLIRGEYPKVMRDLIDQQSKEEGRETSRLPEFDSVWSAKVKGTLDFIGLNYYNAELVANRTGDEDSHPAHPKWKGINHNPYFSVKVPGWNFDQKTFRCHDPTWEMCGAIWQNFHPGGIRRCIQWISDNYDKPTIMITETGCSAEDYRLEDAQRKEFFRLSINAVLKSIREDGFNIIGYVGWSLLDVWEWTSGFTIGFGIVHVDNSTPEMKRSLKDSAKYLGTVFRNNGFPLEAAGV